MLRQVQELNQLVEQDVVELLEQYKEHQTADHDYFERYLDSLSRMHIHSRVGAVYSRCLWTHVS